MHAHHGEPEDDFFEVEIADLPPEEVQSFSGHLVDFGARLLKQAQTAWLTVLPDKQPGEDDKDHFEIYITDLPSEEDEDDTTLEDFQLPSTIPTAAKPIRLFTPRTRNTIFLSLLVPLSLAFVLTFAGTSSLYQGWQALTNYLHPTASTPAAKPVPGETDTSQIPGGTGQIYVSRGIIRVSDGSITILKSSSNNFYTVIPGFVPTATCPSRAQVDLAGQIGEFPLWMGNFDGPDAIIHLPRITVPSLTGWNGWAVPLHLTMKANLNDPVTLTAGNLGDGPSPMFATPDGTSLTTSIGLDYRRAASVSIQATQVHTGAWDTTVFIPTSGCYYFTVGWPRGFWQVIFAAGR
ncbi:MAG TPA: hypothetical protein VFB60_16000 [Ktedonobacteraceae bacterium]|nr:hypothetical protein [Ktedonobacteraceae bacterium]